MVSTKKGLSTLAIIIIGAVMIVGVVWLTTLPNESSNTATSSPTDTTTEEVEEIDEEAQSTNTDSADGDEIDAAGTDTTRTVTYTSDGFSPQTLTVSVGTTIRFENNSEGAMWVASNVHPSHAEYAGTSRSEHCSGTGATDSFDQCASGETYSFTFDKVGEFGYHNHRNAQHGGTIIVQ